MQSLLHKPNLLFLIFVRNQNRAFLLSKLRRPIYRAKLIKALTTIIKYKNGTQEWYLNGKWHRDDGPAVIWAGGTQEWYKNGKNHREDGPAVIWADGTQHWYKNDNWHREDGPAIIWADGTQEWWINGKQVDPF